MRRILFTGTILAVCLTCSWTAMGQTTLVSGPQQIDLPPQLQIEPPEQLLEINDTPHPIKWRDIWFSTEIGFHQLIMPPQPEIPMRYVGDGDLLSDRTCVVRTNNQLTRNLGFMPMVADMGLDAVSYPCRYNYPSPHEVSRCLIFFSLEQSGWSETMGRQISHGDLLTDAGRIYRTNEQLVRNFGPIVSTVDGFGLDAVHVDQLTTVNRGVLFSVERDFYSGLLGTWVGHGDLLAEAGYIYATNQELLANFYPYDPASPDIENDRDLDWMPSA